MFWECRAWSLYVASRVAHHERHGALKPMEVILFFSEFGRVAPTDWGVNLRFCHVRLLQVYRYLR